ncbi:MAG: hypothetical protein HYY95_17020 [Candidatus Rokubacteria bacterium]|nr:hypothetical protein [Candidatus Rokubacteria bacterium]MBI3107241.1 hypothetical protein [Candidatus Rokubacteria bacterium]
MREWITLAFARVEDVVYIGLALLLAGSALALLVDGSIGFVQHLSGGTLAPRVVALLDRILLILIFVELLYTVQVSFREHALIPDPFLIVGVIAATRRVLVLTAESSELLERGQEAFQNAVIELALLIVMIVGLVVSLLLLRKRAPHAVADRP